MDGRDTVRLVDRGPYLDARVWGHCRACGFRVELAVSQLLPRDQLTMAREFATSQARRRLAAHECTAPEDVQVIAAGLPEPKAVEPRRMGVRRPDQFSAHRPDTPQEKISAHTRRTTFQTVDLFARGDDQFGPRIDGFSDWEWVRE